MKHFPLPVEGERLAVAVLADGGFPAPGTLARTLFEGAQALVCCDGAVAACLAAGREPFAVVGDCDSISPSLRKRYADRLCCLTGQEDNDLTKAVHFCASRGMRSLTVLGATGRREDHTLGNVSLLADYMREGLQVRMVTDCGLFEAFTGEALFESFPGQQVSIFALDPTAPVSADGLRYPLPVRLANWWAGTLNESLGSRFTLCVQGAALVFRLLDREGKR